MTTLDYERLLTERLTGWKPDLIGTLMFVRRDDQVLLIHKKRGHGAGKINGPGGKVDPGETVLQAAIRETREETGIEVLDAVEKARFAFLDLQSMQWAGHVFLAHRFKGEPVATDEADPAWYPVDELPFERMWEDDRYWLPRVLAGERLCGEFLFDEGRLLAHRLRPWEED